MSHIPSLNNVGKSTRVIWRVRLFVTTIVVVAFVGGALIGENSILRQMVQKLEPLYLTQIY
tara:strand:- start:149 stop:331 length:183 start_codon:yes stop_codon:yes gene_type:complete